MQVLKSCLIVSLLLLIWMPTNELRAEQWVPSASLEEKFRINAQGLSVPDFDQISLSDLGQVVLGGEIPRSVDATVKYPVSRRWQAGDELTTVLHLSDLPDLTPQQFSLDQIAEITQQPLSNQPLSDYKLLVQQPLSDLVEAIPYLKNFPVRGVRPIADLLDDVAIPAPETIGALLRAQPSLGTRSLQSLKDSPYTLTDIPNATATPIQAFRGWQQQAIADIPGLSQVPLGKMPQRIAGQSPIVAQITALPDRSPLPRINTITGSDVKGFRLSCPSRTGGRELSSASPCAAIDLTEILSNSDQSSRRKAAKLSSNPQQWVLGSVQEVEGGLGTLKLLPNKVGGSAGYEPTGRHPFGTAFKQVLEQIDPTQTLVTSALLFRVCDGEGSCSPYNQFKVPFIAYRLNDLMVIGSDQAANTPTIDTASRYQTTRSGSCIGEVVAGISVNLLTQAIAQINLEPTNTTFVGMFACSSQNKSCGRALGQYRTFSSDPDVQALIQSQPQGGDWLKQLAKGHKPRSEELLQFYPPEAQIQVLRQKTKALLATASQQIPPTIGMASNEETRRDFPELDSARLIARVAQMWLGGTQASWDNLPVFRGDSTDVGVQAQRNYQAQGGNPYVPCPADVPGGELLSPRIAQAVQKLGYFSTKPGPGNGILASAWAVRQVVQSAGISALGDNPDYIPAIARALQQRGIPVSVEESQAGDLAIAAHEQHIGICLNTPCTLVRSQSAALQTFSWESSLDFNGEFDGASVLYRITQP